MPFNPDKTYKNKGWKGFGDWLGTGSVATQDMKFLPFEQAKEFVRTLGLKDVREWEEYRRSGERPKNIPSSPNEVYKDEGWISWGDWLCTGRIGNLKMEFSSFEQAREFVRTLGLRTWNKWTEYRKSDKKPKNIPSAPNDVYKDEGWISWGDWLGTGRIADQKTGWSITKVKELLSSLIQSGTIYQWNEAVLYSFLIRKGLLNLAGSRHYQFFKNLIPASRTEEGRKVIEYYASSNSEIPPDLSKFVTHKIQDLGEEIQVATTQELAHLGEGFDPLDYGEPGTVEQIE
jgi:hypothetical protein